MHGSFLRDPGGRLFPSHARLFIAPCAHGCFAERWQGYVDELWVPWPHAPGSTFSENAS